jgi:molybdate transport system substrate-binding protein
MAIRSRSGCLILRAVALAFVVTACSGPTDSSDLTIAVAASFRATLEVLEQDFEAKSGHDVSIASGSTGHLYAQIRNGAPYDLFLAADQERPRRLVDAGLGAPESVFTYATGRLAIWSADPDRVNDMTLAQLGEVEFRAFAIAEPEVAPYGTAAREVLRNLGVWEEVRARVVTGQNVAQAFAHLSTRNAELGLIALSQAESFDGASSWRAVPEHLHGPIRQDAILLNRSANPQVAVAFLDYLKSPPAAAIIRNHGFEAAPRP